MGVAISNTRTGNDKRELVPAKFFAMRVDEASIGRGEPAECHGLAVQSYLSLGRRGEAWR